VTENSDIKTQSRKQTEFERTY